MIARRRPHPSRLPSRRTLWLRWSRTPFSPTRTTSTLASSKLYGRILVAFTYLLRISEASSIRRTDILDHCLRIRPAKSQLQYCWRAASPFIYQWLQFLRQSLPCTTSGDLLQRQLADSFAPNTPRVTWHSLRRGGAATLVSLGLTPEQLSQLLQNTPMP